MKLLIALICSVFLHLAWLFFWPLQLNNDAKGNAAFNHARPLELNMTRPQPRYVKPSSIAAKNTSSIKTVRQSQPHLRPLTEKVVRQVAPVGLKQVTPVELKNESGELYLSSKDVDIQALPMNNIDASMLPAAMQNTQVKLRLYIDELGKVVRIEPIKSQLYQDQALEAALSDRLTHISFTPAKRNGLDVKSYQEVAYDFNVSIQFTQANRAP